MLEKIESLSENTMNLIIYTNSASIEYFVKNTLKERFKVHKDFIVSPEVAKDLHTAKLDSYVAPLLCSKWLIHVNADKIGKKELITALNTNTMHGITVFWTTKYRTYKMLTDLEIVKKQGVYCNTYSFSRLDSSEIFYLYNKMMGEKYKKSLSKELLNYVCKTYNYDVQAVCDLFTLLKSGNEVSSKKEIIELIGVGGNSVDSFTVKLLTTDFKNEKGKKRAVKKVLQLLEDLSVSYKYKNIRRFMMTAVDGFIDMKQLQIMGYYRKINSVIPESYDSKRLARLRRFEFFVLNKISLPKLLNLKLCLLNYNDFNSEIALIQAIYAFYNSFDIEAQ